MESDGVNSEPRTATSESPVQIRARQLGRVLKIAGGLQIAVYGMMVVLFPALLSSLAPPNSSCGNWMFGVFFWFVLVFVFVIQGGAFLASGAHMASMEFERAFTKLYRATWVDFVVGALILLLLWGDL